MFVALNAFAGGYYGMSGARDVPLDWLKSSPFHSYFIPGLFLFVFVGGSSLIAAIAVFKRHHLARKAAFISGFITLIWLSMQVTVIGYVSWMQPTTAIVTVIIILLTLKLPVFGHR